MSQRCKFKLMSGSIHHCNGDAIAFVLTKRGHAVPRMKGQYEADTPAKCTVEDKSLYLHTASRKIEHDSLCPSSIEPYVSGLCIAASESNSFYARIQLR